MSPLNPATAYRRSTDRPRIPVVLPHVRVHVDEQGLLDVFVDEAAYADANHSAEATLSRADLRPLLDRIARERGSALRVEIHEPDGKAFTDFHTLEPEPADAPPPVLQAPVVLDALARDQRASLSATLGAGVVNGQGFEGGEEVAVAVVIYRRAAADDGTIQLRLPVALLEQHRAGIVLVGDTSGTVTISSLRACTPAREAS